MLVKNIGKKCIGFGSLVLPPDAVGTLPAGYGSEHPTVKFYISKKWLAPVNGETKPAEPPALTEEEKAASQKKAEIEEKIRSLSRMNLEQLRGEAFALGVNFVETDTKNMITQKITEKLQAELG